MRDTTVRLKTLIIDEGEFVHLKTDVVRQLEKFERAGIVLKSLSCVSQDQSPLCYSCCTLLGEDRIERFMVCAFATSETIMEKALTVVSGLEVELGS